MFDIDSVLTIVNFTLPILIAVLLNHFGVSDKKIIVTVSLCYLVALGAFFLFGYNGFDDLTVQKGARNNALTTSVIIQLALFLIFFYKYRRKQ